MKKINVKLRSQKSYEIVIGKNLIKKLYRYLPKKNYSQIIIISDAIVGKLFGKTIEENLKKNLVNTAVSFKNFKSSESNKNLNLTEQIWRFFSKKNLDRQGLVVILGGGVIGDVGAFAASTYLRGVDFVQIPTTIISQVDSSVGGKTGIDFLGGKNIIGTFAQPSLVVCDIDTLKTLPERQFNQGFAEVIKYALTFDFNFFKDLQKMSSYKDFLPKQISDFELINLIHRSLEIKKGIVEKDEKESLKIRDSLNFGHTFGHALEMLLVNTSNFLYHGEAVSLGMVFASRLSFLKNLITIEEFNMILELLNSWKLPTDYHIYTKSKTNRNKIKSLLKKDKKKSGKDVNWVLLNGIGNCLTTQKVDGTFYKKAIKS